MYEFKLTLVMALFFIIVTGAVQAQLGLNEEHRPRKRSGHFLDTQIQKTREDLIRGVNCNLDCRSESRDPVCGTNGQTYDSICDLERDICKKRKVKLKHNGECSLKEKCLDERAYQLEQVAEGNMVFVPTCLPDGSYAHVQCHNFTSYCWCSSIDGKLMQETIQKDNKPQCVADRCRCRKRKLFFENMTGLLMQGFENNVGRDVRSHREAIKWKFSQLDGNRDGVLKRQEYRRFRKTVRKHVYPKKCARQFPRFCDTNQDEKLTQDEWTNCFFARPCRSKTRCKGKKNRGRRCGKPTPKPPRIKPSCTKDRTTFLEGASNANYSIPIPVCQRNGKYRPLQCHKDICFCVDELTGNSLEGTARKNGTPDCTKPLPHAREWPGCTGKNKTKFMEDLQKYLLKKVNDSERSSAANASSPQSVDEFAAIYHFRHLDRNSNNMLEKRERKEVKKFLKRPKLRTCGKKMTSYCDVNKDQKVSLEEWVACVILPRRVDDVSNGSGGGEVEIRKYDENPLHIYLTAEDEERHPRHQRDVARKAIIPLR